MHWLPGVQRFEVYSGLLVGVQTLRLVGRSRPVALGLSCTHFCHMVYTPTAVQLLHTSVMREKKHARQKCLAGGKGLVWGLILVACVWFGVRPEVIATAVAGIHLTLSANPCDALQEVQRKNQDLRKYKKKLPWPKLKCFAANGVIYSLPLRADSKEPSQRPAEASLAYLAGFFDGDGCVCCRPCLSGASLKVGQSFDQAEVLLLCQQTFGGSISQESRGIGLRKPSLQWQAYGQSARAADSLLAPHSLTKQKQLLLAAEWPDARSRREECKAELRALKECDTAVAGACSWRYFAGFFDAEGCISQLQAGVSLRLIIVQKHPQVWCLSVSKLGHRCNPAESKRILVRIVNLRLVRLQADCTTYVASWTGE